VCGHHAPAAFTPGKDPIPIVQEAGWAPEPVWIGAENLAPPGFDSQTFQPVASRYPRSHTRQKMYVHRNNEARSRNYSSRPKARYITYSACVSVALVIQHAKRMRRLSYSTTFFHIISYRRGIKKKVLGHKMCALSFYVTFVGEIPHSEKNVICLQVKYPLFLSYFDENGTVSTNFRKILKYQVSRKSVQWEPSCSMRTDRRT
jgi:hypothetical protein